MTTTRSKRFLSRYKVYALLGVAFTLILLAWALRNISPLLVWNAIQSARWEWLGLGLLTFLASFSVRAQRWGTLLAADRNHGSFGIRQSAIFIGYAGNCVLPASAGEVVRAAVLHRFGGVSFGAAVGSIFAERLLDAVVAFLFLLMPLLPGASFQQQGLGTLPLGWIGVALGAICCIFLAAANYPQAIARLAGNTSRMLGFARYSQRIVTSVEAMLCGLDALRYPKRVVVAVIETFCIWGLSGMTYWFGLLAFGITAPGIAGAMFVQSVTALAIAIPSSPGYFGPFEAAIRFALGVYAIPPDTIVAYALALRVLMYVSVTTIGFAIAARLGLSGADFIPKKSAASDRG